MPSTLLPFCSFYIKLIVIRREPQELKAQADQNRKWICSYSPFENSYRVHLENSEFNSFKPDEIDF